MSKFLNNVRKSSESFNALFAYKNNQFTTDGCRIHSIKSAFDYGQDVITLEGSPIHNCTSAESFLNNDFSLTQACFFSLSKEEKKVLMHFLKSIEKQPDGVLVQVIASEIHFSYSDKNFNFEFKPWNSQVYVQNFEFRMDAKYFLDLISENLEWYFEQEKQNAPVFFRSQDGTKTAVICPLSE